VEPNLDTTNPEANYFKDFKSRVQTSELKGGKPTYHHFQLDIHINAKERHTHIIKIWPVSTSKYNL